MADTSADAAAEGATEASRLVDENEEYKWGFVTDIVDGWLARRGQQVTHIGKLLDPLADKLIVSTALIVLVATARIPLWATWMAVVIVGRELAVTGLRGLASSQGQVMAASGSGKIKTFAQNVAIGNAGNIADLADLADLTDLASPAKPGADRGGQE